VQVSDQVDTLQVNDFDLLFPDQLLALFNELFHETKSSVVKRD